MSWGPGKYDEETTEVRKKTGGQVILIVMGGFKGSGFSVQISADTLLAVPNVLRELASEIEKDLEKMRRAN